MPHHDYDLSREEKNAIRAELLRQQNRQKQIYDYGTTVMGGQDPAINTQVAEKFPSGLKLPPLNPEIKEEKIDFHLPDKIFTAISQANRPMLQAYTGPNFYSLNMDYEKQRKHREQEWERSKSEIEKNKYLLQVIHWFVKRSLYQAIWNYLSPSLTQVYQKYRSQELRHHRKVPPLENLKNQFNLLPHDANYQKLIIYTNILSNSSDLSLSDFLKYLFNYTVTKHIKHFTGTLLIMSQKQKDELEEILLQCFQPSHSNSLNYNSYQSDNILNSSEEKHDLRLQQSNSHAVTIRSSDGWLTEIINQLLLNNNFFDLLYHGHDLLVMHVNNCLTLEASQNDALKIYKKNRAEVLATYRQSTQLSVCDVRVLTRDQEKITQAIIDSNIGDNSLITSHIEDNSLLVPDLEFMDDQDRYITALHLVVHQLSQTKDDTRVKSLIKIGAYLIERGVPVSGITAYCPTSILQYRNVSLHLSWIDCGVNSTTATTPETQQALIALKKGLSSDILHWFWGLFYRSGSASQTHVIEQSFHLLIQIHNVSISGHGQTNLITQIIQDSNSFFALPSATTSKTRLLTNSSSSRLTINHEPLELKKVDNLSFG